MDFTKLPTHLIESVLEKCTFQTIVKCRRTCSSVDDIIRKRKLDKLNYQRIGFHMQEDASLDVIFANVLLDRNGTEEDAERDEELSESKGVFENADPNLRIRQILNSMHPMTHLVFDNITIDDEFLNVIKEVKINLKKVTANYYDCAYSVSKSDMISLWNMFESTNENSGVFNDNNDDFFNDLMMEQTLSTVQFSVPDYLDTPNITDNTLELLAERRPSAIEFPKFVVNYTVEGIKRLFKRIIDSHDPSIDNWYIGTIRPDIINFFRMIEEFEEFENNLSSVIVRTAFKIEGYFITVSYNKENPNECGSITVGYIAPPEMFTYQPLADMNVRRGVIQVIRNAQNRIELVELEEDQRNNNEMEL